MPDEQSALGAAVTKCLRAMILAAAIAPALLALTTGAWADHSRHRGGGDGEGNGQGQVDNSAIRLVKVIPVPVSGANTTAGALYSFDISWVDQASQTYYLADRSNKRVDIVDAKTGTFLAQLSATPSFAGVSAPAFATATAGPDGVTTGGHCLFVTDAPSRVVSFDTSSFPPTQVSDVHTATPTANRADELAYDPSDKVLLVINNADTPPFGTFITVNPATCVLTPPTAANKLTLDAAHGVDAQNGAEQPVWEPVTRRFYLSIPQVGTTVSHGAVVRIKPGATSVAASDVLGVDFCSPAGLAVGPQQDLFIGCNAVFDTAGNVWNPTGTLTAAPQDVIIDAKDGSINAHVYGVGAGDEVWFNPGDGNYYATGNGSPFRPLPAATAQGATPLGVVGATDGTVLQQLTTYNVPAVLPMHPAGSAHSVAANAANNLIFVPLGANNAFSAFAVPHDGSSASLDCATGCIAVFGHARAGEND